MKYLIFVFTFLGCANSTIDDHYINLQGDNFVLVTDKYFSRELSFSSLPNDKAFYMTYWGASPTAELRYGEQSVPIFYRGNDSEKLYLQLNNQVKTLTFHIQGKPARYSTEYIQQQRGKVTAEVPEVYELTNIVLALADEFQQINYGRRVQGDYYQAMIKWFTPFKAHPIFTSLGDVDYYSLVENGPAYQFMNDRIVKSEVYSSFRTKDAIAMHRALLENFAKISDFRSFYQQHQPYYSTLLKQFENDTHPKNIWSWLESQFSARYQSYKVFFSPLGSGKHSARMFTNNGFKESIMFISGPNRYENSVDSTETSAIKLTRAFFTEIDHAYVNPISDSYINEINDSLPELETWYKGGGYNKPYLVFNEYMTWSVFLLYALESYSDEEYLMIKHHMEDFMVNKRGFYKFKAFNKELTRIYKKRSQEQTIEDLYEPIIKWLKTH